MDEFFIIHVMFIMITVLYMFLANNVGQEIMDYYTASLNVRKLILFLLQRGNRIFILKVGGLYTASLECFASVKS